MHQVVAALGTATLGLVANVLGQVAEGAALGPWAQVGGIATAVGALAYVAKLLADGRLVALPIAEMQKASEVRERRLEELVQEGAERETSFRLMLINQERGR